MKLLITILFILAGLYLAAPSKPDAQLAAFCAEPAGKLACSFKGVRHETTRG